MPKRFFRLWVGVTFAVAAYLAALLATVIVLGFAHSFGAKVQAGLVQLSTSVGLVAALLWSAIPLSPAASVKRGLFVCLASSPILLKLHYLECEGDTAEILGCVLGTTYGSFKAFGSLAIFVAGFTGFLLSDVPEKDIA